MVDPGGRSLIVYCDLHRLEADLKELSPADRRLDEALCEGARRFTRFDMSLLAQQPRTLMGPLDWARLGSKMLPYVGPLAQWGLLSARAFGARFKDALLRRVAAQMFA
jgi:hypothetical protein